VGLDIIYIKNGVSMCEYFYNTIPDKNNKNGSSVLVELIAKGYVLSTSVQSDLNSLPLIIIGQDKRACSYFLLKSKM